MAPPAAGEVFEKDLSTVSSKLADVHVTAEKTYWPVHLVGSVPLANEAEVFHTLGTILGEHIHSIPDGETGGRINFVFWQIGVLARNPALEGVGDMNIEYGAMATYRLRPDADPLSISFDNLGYADNAIASYQTFAKLKKEGAIAATTRFQVDLPTPFATITTFVDVGSQAAVEGPYEAAMLAEVDRVCAAIPHDQLTIQWDIAPEFAYWEGVGWGWHVDGKDVQGTIIERIVRTSEHVPTDVAMGYHFCYGEVDHQHFVQPKDMANLVAVANRISTAVTRPISYIHMPVPRDRDDEAYFAPLENLRLQPETGIYLGLVHWTDGVEGAKRRIATAQKFAPKNFGIGTECGLGRRPLDTIVPLLEIHRTVAATTTN